MVQRCLGFCSLWSRSRSLSVKSKVLFQRPQSNQFNTESACHRVKATPISSYARKTEAANGVGLQMTLLLLTARPLRVRTSTIAAIAHIHIVANGGSRPLDDGEVIYRYSNDFWFVKVVCTLFVRSHCCLDSFVGYLSNNLTPGISFEVIRRLNNPKLGLKFLDFSRINLNLIHSFQTYNLLIRNLCEMGLCDLATGVFDYMRSDGHFPNSSIIKLLILSFSKVGKFYGVKKLLSGLLSEGFTMKSMVYNSLLNDLIKQNKVDEAVRIFEEFVGLCSHPDTCTFNILIRGLCQKGEVNKCFELFHGMGRYGCSPDVVTYNTLISGLCRVNEVDKGHELLMEVKLRGIFSPDVVTYTSLLSGYCKMGKMEEASSIFSEMISSATKPNIVTFNALIDGFGKVGDMVSAKSMFERMLSCGYFPDVVTFTSLIDGYCRNGEVNQGLKLWEEMNARNLSPNVYTFAIIINSLCKENRLNEACQFLTQLKWSHIVPKPFMYNPVIDGFCKAGNVNKANTIVAEMEEKKCRPDKVTFTILIIGHCMNGRMFEAISIFDKMLAIGCTPDDITVNSLSSCLLKAGMPNEALRIKRMHQKS